MRAVDADGGTGPEAVRAFAVDLTAPATVIGAHPPALGREASGAFAFSSSDTSATFECRLGAAGAAFSACTSPAPFAALPDGSYEFAVRATDAAGNTSAPTTLGFAIDTVAPQTTISPTPADVVDTATPSFAFTAGEPGASFECQLDDEPAWRACTAPFVTPPLGEGRHSFAVRATDAAGNRDPSRAIWSFVVDTSTPDTLIATGPAGPSASPSAAFTFGSPDGGARFECRLDGGAWEGCASGKAYAELLDGPHRFEVRAFNRAGTADPVPAARAFTVDTTAPDTRIISTPGTTASPSFAFEASEPGARFECRLDAGPWEACASPKGYAALAVGAHTFLVRAIDPSGNVDGSEAHQAFAVSAGGVAGVQATGGGPTTRPASGDTTGPRVSISSRHTSLIASARGVVVFSVGPVREPVSGVLGLRTSGAVRSGPKGRRSVLALGTRFLRAPTGGRAVARITLSRGALAALRSNRTMKVQATITLRDLAGNSTTRIYRFTLRAPARR